MWYLTAHVCEIEVWLLKDLLVYPLSASRWQQWEWEWLWWQVQRWVTTEFIGQKLEFHHVLSAKDLRYHKLWALKIYTDDFFPFSAHTQRLLKLQSILRRAPSYRTLELQLIEWQERELFEYFVVVSLKKKPSKNSYFPEVTYQFPKVQACLVVRVMWNRRCKGKLLSPHS